jgi:type IV secretory pathway VirB3-like protein
VTLFTFLLIAGAVLLALLAVLVWALCRIAALDDKRRRASRLSDLP